MHKVIVGTDGSYEAYDLATDPGEARSQPDASWAVALRERGEDVLAGLPASEATTDFTGPRNTEALRELGYVE
jgi:hypothetical protein